MSFPTITFCLIFSPLLRYKICPRRCSEWLASSPGTSDKGTEVTIILGHGPIPYKHAPPLLGWQLCPFLGWMSSDIRLPSHGILGRALPHAQLEYRTKLAHTCYIKLLLVVIHYSTLLLSFYYFQFSLSLLSPWFAFYISCLPLYCSLLSLSCIGLSCNLSQTLPLMPLRCRSM